MFTYRVIADNNVDTFEVLDTDDPWMALLFGIAWREYGRSCGVDIYPLIPNFA